MQCSLPKPARRSLAYGSSAADGEGNRGASRALRRNEADTGFINVIGGGVDLFGVNWLPVEFAQPFALQMRFAEAEAEQEFQIGMAILGPDLQEVGLPTEFPITPTLGELHAEGWEGIIHIAGTVGLYAKEAGAHEISIRIDGTHSWSIPFRVVYGPEGEVETE